MGGSVSTAATNIIDGTIKTGLAIDKQRNEQIRQQQEDDRRNEREKRLMDSVFSRYRPTPSTSNQTMATPSTYTPSTSTPNTYTPSTSTPSTSTQTMATKKFKPDVKPVKRSRKNFGYPDDPKYGDVTILEFMATVWARLAYMKNTNFLAAYKLIFQDDVIITQWEDVTKNITTSDNITIKTLMERVSNDSSYLNNFIPFLPLAQKINLIIGEDALAKKTGWIVNNRTEEATNCTPILNIPKDDKENIIFTSISTSNYSGCYVFADTRMPNIIGVSFRGTYSMKAAGSYMQPKYIRLTSIIPNSNIKVLTGIYKIMIEMVHTIINTIEDIKQQLRTKTNSTNEIKVIVTGHSLGGGLATLFSYVYMKTTMIKKDKLCCISIGSPRVFNKDAAIDFCNMCTTQKLFEYRRLTTTNDPVTILPYAAVTEYQHPCSDKSQVKFREEIFRDCYPQVSNSFSKRCLFSKGKFAMTSNYDLPLNCTKKNKGWYSSTFNFPIGMSYHCMYLGILFAGGIEPLLYIKSNTKKQDPVEINRFNNHKDTACKLCCYDGEVLRIVYFNLTYFRKQNGAFMEDVYVTKENYATIKTKLRGYSSTNGIDINGLVPESNAIETNNPNEPFVPSDKPAPEATIDVATEAISNPPPEETLSEAISTPAEGASPEPATEVEPTVDGAEPFQEETVDGAATEVEPTVDGAEPVESELAPAADPTLDAIPDSPAEEPIARPEEDAEKQTSMVGGLVQFPTPNVTEEFLLKIETNVSIPPIEDPNEVMTEEEIKNIQRTTDESSKAVEQKSKEQAKEELKGGKRTTRIKHKRKKQENVK